VSEACETVSSAEIETCAARWLERRDRDNWSQTDQSALDAWLAQSPAHEIAFWRLDAAWSRTDRLIVLRDPKQDIAAPARWRVPAWAKMAAGFAALAMLGMAFASLQKPPQDRVFTTPLGGHETIAFADGSKIELNTSTILRARMTSDERTIWLEKGEAFFKVKHDAAHPFVVIAGARRITDLGTEFSVRRDSDQLKVAVLEGRVRLGSADAAASARVLTQGQVAAATAEAMVVTRRSVQSLANELSWRQGVLVFDETALGEAAAEFNRYNREQLVIADSSVARLVIAGTLPTNDIEGFARLAQTVLGLHVEHEQNNIVISR